MTIIDSLCIVNTGWKTKEEKELFDIAYDVIKKESKILHLQYQKFKLEYEIKVTTKLLNQNKMKAKLVKHESGFILYDEDNITIGVEPNVLSSNIFSKLSTKNCQAIERGYDLDEIKRKLFGGFDGQPDSFTIAAVERTVEIMFEILSDKKFSEKDMINFSEFVSGKYINQYKFLRDKSLKGFFSTEEILNEYQSLQQTEWDVEIEMIDYGIGNDEDGRPVIERKPLLDADGCLILKIKSE